MATSKAAEDVDFGAHGGVIVPFQGAIRNSWDRGHSEIARCRCGVWVGSSIEREPTRRLEFSALDSEVKKVFGAVEG